MATCFFLVANFFLTAKAFMAPLQDLMTSLDGQAVFTVPLDKQESPVFSRDRQVGVKTVFSGRIFAGPQNFTAVFDTGSGHLILPSIDCTDEPCKTRQRYSHAASLTATQIDFDGVEVPANLEADERDQVELSYGTGEITGDFVRDTVCVGMSAAAVRATKGGAITLNSVNMNIDSDDNATTNCARVRVITALQMSTDPFSSFNFDGILGLGLPALALDPEFHFFGQLAKQMKIRPIFSFFLSWSADVRSEITFGGHNSKRMVGGPEAVKFVPVESPQDGHWRVQIHGVRVGNTSLPFCENSACTAIVDTGTSTIGVPSDAFDDLADWTWRILPDHVRTQVPESGWPDCRHVPGPPLIFDMGDFEIILQAEDYSRPIPLDIDELDEDGLNVTRAACSSSLTPLELPDLGQGVFIWGKPVLQKYYTMYDVQGERVGFVTAMHPSPEERLPSEISAAQATADAVLQI